MVTKQPPAMFHVDTGSESSGFQLATWPGPRFHILQSLNSYWDSSCGCAQSQRFMQVVHWQGFLG